MLGDFKLITLQDDPDIHWPAADIPDVDIPTAFDWRDHNAVTPIKNQVIFRFFLRIGKFFRIIIASALTRFKKSRIKKSPSGQTNS